MSTISKESALKILQLNKHFTKEELKQSFRRNALKYHPDKTNSNTEDEFIQIHAAYTLLSNDTQTYTYEDLLKEFVDHVNTKDSILIQILGQMVKLKEEYSINMYKKLDTTRALNVYYIFKKYNDIFMIPEPLMDEFEKILLKNSKGKNIYIIKPTIQDLYEANIYKLNYKKEAYYIPLWHEEVYFNTSNNPLTVKCIPSLSPDISIDEQNNIHFTTTHTLSTILHDKHIEITVYKEQILIPVDSLHIKRSQTIKLLNKGIPVINEEDIYCNKEISHLFVHVVLVF